MRIMKTKIFWSVAVAAMLIAGSALSSCSDEYAQAPVTYPVGGSAENIGSGTWNDPFQCWQAAVGTTAGVRTTNWVTGYLVGAIRPNATNTMASAQIYDGETPVVGYNNVLIAQIPYDEEEWEKAGYTIDDCVPVQLPSGGCRNLINLNSNPGYFNRQISLRGTTGEKYMGTYGIRSCYEFNWGPVGRYEEPMREIGGDYFCDFQASRDFKYYEERGWRNFVERGGLDGWVVGEYSGVRYISTSAHYGSETGGPYLMWAVSPELDLDLAESKTLSFRSQTYQPTSIGTLEVYVLTDSNPRACEPVKINAVIPGTTTWTSSGIIDLSEFSGKIHIGFLYRADSGGQNLTTQYRITDFNFGNANPEDWEVVNPDELVTYRRVRSLEELVSGNSYAILFGNKMAEPLSGATHGALKARTVKISNDSFTGKAGSAFTLTCAEATGLWTIQDAEGQFYYLVGTYDNPNVSASEPATGQWYELTDTPLGVRIKGVLNGRIYAYSDDKNGIYLLTASQVEDLDGAEFYEIVPASDAD